jgi:antitoxin component of RelBE/YafQ-DinJ toxin-antitoxin module
MGETLIVRLSERLKSAAQAKATAVDVTMSQAVRSLLRQWVQGKARVEFSEDLAPDEE